LEFEINIVLLKDFTKRDMMNANTIILALALTLIANEAMAARSVTGRNGRGETRIISEAEREALRAKERGTTPDAVNQSVAKQQHSNRVNAERSIRVSFNGTLTTKSLTNVDALIELNSLLPMSRVPEILNKAVEAEVTLLNRQQRKGVDSPLLRIASKNLQVIDAIAQQVTLGNPKYRTEAGKKEIQDLLEVIEVELMNTKGWSATRVRNLEVFEDVLIGGLRRGLLPSEAVALQARFTWEELKERCKRFLKRA